MSIKKFVGAIINRPVVAVVLMLAGTAAAQEWDCGEEPGTVTCTLDAATGTFTISGAGDMSDFNSATNAPWWYHKKMITNVVFEDGVTAIGRDAFGSANSQFYDSVKTISIGSGLTTPLFGAIGTPLNSLYGITSIEVSADNPRYTSANGILFTKAQDTLVRYPSCKSGASYTIPNSVTSINRSAFTHCDNLTSVTISDGVTSIGENPFYDCDNLTSITIGSGVAYIGDLFGVGLSDATAISWSNIYSLASITVSADNPSFSSVDGVLFSKAQDILVRYPMGKRGASYSIPDGVTMIGDNAFMNARNLMSVRIPDGVTGISHRAFRGCTGLKVIISLGATPPTCGTDAFRDVPAAACLFVPEESIDLYKAAAGWNWFTCVNGVTEDVLAAVPVSEVVGIPAAMDVDKTLDLKLAVAIPDTATNKTIVWSIDGFYPSEGSSITITDGVLSIASLGEMSEDMKPAFPEGALGAVTIAATIADGLLPGVDFVQGFRVNIYPEGTVSVKTSDRVVPSVNTENVAAIVIPTNSVGFGFSVGPNPVKKSDGVVKFFVGANSVRPLLGTGNITGKLTIYDATGNVVRKIDVNKNMSWDLRDSKNRPVSSGTYLARGVITVNGKREKVSIVIGVR